MLLNIDLKDRKILYQLDLDCRQSNTQIGKKVGLSKQVVDYRIKRLIHNKTITRFSSVIDTYKLGLSKYKIYLSLQNADKKTIQELISYFKNHTKTEWIATCSGKWDLIAGYIVKNEYEFNNALKDLYEHFSTIIASREISVSTGVPHWRKEYLLNRKEPTPFLFQGRMKEEDTLDSIDNELIKVIVNNARMPITQIAKRIGTTTRIATYRLKRLQKEKIILMHRIFFNLNKYNWIYCKALLTFKNLTQQKRSQFMEYCNHLPNLTYTINCIGSWDLEMDFEIENFNAFHRIMLNLRDRFADIIKQYDFAIIMNENKLDYFPGCYPQESF